MPHPLPVRSTIPENPPGLAPHFYGLQDSVYEIVLHEPAPGPSGIPEAVVQDIWQRLLFDRSNLLTHDGRSIRILNPGRLNTDGGPDFRNAAIRIADQEWHGDVEIHLTSKGWPDHRHHEDARYNSVILHVVLQSDASTGKLRRADGSPLPELILQPHLNATLRSLIHGFHTRSSGPIPCATWWASVPDDVRSSYIEQLARERMQAKKEHRAQAFLLTPDPDELLYEELMAGLGYAPNAEAMRTLARRIPLSIARTLEDPLDLEALYFGVAGLLPAPAELLHADRQTIDFAVGLADRFERLNRSLILPVMDRPAWQFFRLRPANFPPLRIAQAVALLRSDPPGLLYADPLGRLSEALKFPKPVAAVRRLLTPPLHPFWNRHVRLDRPARPHNPALGRQRADTLITNAVAPVLLLYAEQQSDPALEELVFKLLRKLPAESDTVTRIFEALGTRAKQALAGQGLHQLYRTQCLESRCLTCAIGRHLLGRPEGH